MSDSKNKDEDTRPNFFVTYWQFLILDIERILVMLANKHEKRWDLNNKYKDTSPNYFMEF